MKLTSKSSILIGSSIAFAGGILVASVYDLPDLQIYLAVAASIAVLAICLVYEHKLSAVVALFFLAAGLGALRLNSSFAGNEYQDQFDQKQTLEGYLVADPDVRENRQQLTVLPKGHKQNILVVTRLDQEFAYGDELAITGKPVMIENFSEFDYAGYLERYNIYAQMKYPKVLILRSNQLNPLLRVIFWLKAQGTARLSELFGSPQSELLLGILIGARKNLPADLVQDFNNTGTSHIIAVSGFNVTIIIFSLMALAKWFGRRWQFYLTLLLIFALVVMAGATASVVRAAIMGLLLLWAQRAGRQYRVAPALFFAGLVMLILNPRILYWDIGFGLSFTATLGIIYFLPLLEHFCRRLPNALGLKTALLGSLAAIFATLPLNLWQFGRLSLSAPLVNLLVLPVVPWAMLFGFLSLLPIVGPGMAFLANGLLLYIIRLENYFGGLPYSSVSVKSSGAAALGFGLLLIGLYAVAVWLKKKFSRAKLAKDH